MTQEERNEKSLEEILNAGIREFGLYGYKKSSLNRMCLNSGISKGKLYHYFSDKVSLFYACLYKAYGDFIGFMDVYRPEPSISLELNLHNFFHRRQYFFYEHPYYPRLFFAALPWSNPPGDPTAEIKEYLRQYSDCIQNILKQIFSLYADSLNTDMDLAIEVVHIAVNRIQFDHGFPKWDPENPSEELLNSNLWRFDRLIHLLLYGALKKE